VIFGFNTDIKVQDTVYHVQTEVHEQERRLESQVFVSGRCIGKRSSPLPPGDPEVVQELARAQHRWVLEAVRDGFVDDVLNQETVEELVVHFLGSRRLSAGVVLLRFRILCGGFVAAAAQVGARWNTESGSGEIENTLTNDAGVAEVRLALTDNSAGTAELEVRARVENREMIRRFLVKSARV
jgi:hypothetical protein